MVIGNKSNLYEVQIISKKEGKEYAKSTNTIFYETSATVYECMNVL